MIVYNRKKNEGKLHYTKIQQLKGALDALETISSKYTLVPKKETVV